MMRKWILPILLIMILTLSGCKTDSTPTDVVCDSGFHLEGEQCVEDSTDNPIIDEDVGNVNGLDDIDVIVGHYFHPLDGVSITTDQGTNITHLLNVSGHVDYSTTGTYVLVYTMTYNDDIISHTRTVTVKDGTYTTNNELRPSVTTGSNTLGSGSYFTGSNSDLDHPTNPVFIDDDLIDSAVPSTGWWTQLLVQNHGGGNGIYTNPLRIAYGNEGMEITNPLDGFVQYWNVGGVQTIAQFPIALKDSFLTSTTLQGGYETSVIDYGDAHVKVALRQNGSSVDQMVTTLVQGSPYVFVEVNDKDSLRYNLDSAGVDGYEYYDLDGNLITTSTHTGDAIIAKLVHRHCGYDTTPPANVGAAQYCDKYYLINTPDNTQFTIASNGHPFGLLNQLQISLGDSNYLSINPLNDLSEAAFYHEHAYTFINDSDVSYTIDYENSVVHTLYYFNTSSLQGDASALLAMMPHHYKYSDAVPSSYSYRTVRGTLQVLESNYFTTELSFHGLLPGFTTPSNPEFSSTTAVSYLEDLDTQIDTSNPEDFINDEGPYWNSKAIYPLSQAIIISDQLGEDTLRDSFIEKLKYVLLDWYTYTDSSDEKFLYYNNQWGSVYYSNDDFGTATALSDHSFTHGYLIYASSVLAMYDSDFVTDYGDMVDLLLDDYMYPLKDDANFEYLRNFDPYAGHSWAHGFGTFAEGNNLESTSEALNSWNGGYLWALATGDTDRMEAAIYGFTTELSAIKEYWFDYDETNWDPAYGDYVDVAGMVWGGKHDYATWFGANPTFIYGIQWLPSGEYLTNYALNDTELTKLSSIYATYLAAKGGSVDTWYSNMWAIQSIVDSTAALTNFDSTKILNDDYPNELIGSYWMINAMASLQQKTQDVWMKVDANVASTIYEVDTNSYRAMVWNPSTQAQTIEFYNSDGLLLTYTIEANTFEEITIQ